MNKACAAYCTIALLNALLTANTQPATRWDWFRYLASAMVALATAWKTYYSEPPPNEPVQVVAPPGKPLPVIETKKTTKS